MTLDTNRLATPVAKETGGLWFAGLTRGTNGTARMHIAGTSRGDTPAPRNTNGGHPRVCRTKAPC